MPTVTASAKAAIQSGAGLHIQENFEALLEKGLDDVFQRTFSFPMQGAQFFTERSTNKLTENFQSVVGIGNIGRSRDADYIPHDEKQLGFPNAISNHTYRGRIGHEKTLVETEQYGMVGDSQKQLADGAKRSIELIMADVFNRALGASGAPFVCEDGMYLIDSGRPNPHPKAGLWSNLEAASAITANSIFTAQLNARAYVSERGHLSPLKVAKIIAQPSQEQVLWEISQSDLRPADSMNAKNFQKGKFEYMTYDHLTTSSVFYMLEGAQNELYFQWRVRPELKTWEGADNPDIYWQRIRFACGVGCNRPTAWRGGTVS